MARPSHRSPLFATIRELWGYMWGYPHPDPNRIPPAMALSELAVKNAKPADKPYKLTDGEGLYLQVTPSGGKLWRLKYRFQGKEKLLALGPYPAVSIKMARERKAKARTELAEGQDPGAIKKQEALEALVSAANTFGAVAEELIAKRDDEGLKGVTSTKARWLIAQLGEDLYARPISEITPRELLAALKRVETSGRLETARRCRSLAGRVFRYAIATQRAERDISADLRGALKAPRSRHHAAILDPKTLGELLRAIDEFQGQPTTIWALKLSAHVFARPGEIRQAEWSEFDLESSVWRIPASKMKMGREHVVPLPTQVVEMLTEARRVTGRGKYVFPAIGNKLRPMSENTVNMALRRMGYGPDEMTAHGFRATASSLLNECGLWSCDAIERALAHVDTNEVRSAYHRGSHWAERVKMGQWWSDYLDSLRSNAIVI